MSDIESDIEIDYQYLADRALRRVVRDVLEMTADLGAAPGEHHFYIEFATQAPGVDIPERLLAEYPERMTIVLQHQFTDLEVTEEGFSVTLSFNRTPSRLSIPFDAVTNFVDPAVRFQLHFAALNDEAADAPALREDENPDATQPDAQTPDADPTDTSGPAIFKPAPAGASKDTDAGETETEPRAPAEADVVSLDAFRKK